MTRDLLLAAWVDGFQAQRRGTPLTRNPYSQSGATHWRWRLGWQSAEDTQGAVDPEGAFAASAAAVAADATAREIAADSFPQMSARAARKARRKLQRRKLLAGLLPGLACATFGVLVALTHMGLHPDHARQVARDVTSTLQLPI